MANSETTTNYKPNMAAARDWARIADADDYLIEYNAEQDPGSRCGFDDAQLDELKRILGRRGLTLEADDRGLIAEVKHDAE
jgi:hypothetical protein